MSRFQTINYFDGQDVRVLLDAQLMAAIRETQVEIKTLEDLGVESKTVAGLLDKANDTIAKLVEILDTEKSKR